MVSRTNSPFVLGAVIASATLFAHPAQANDFYEGQTIRVVINSAAGAATDAGARLFANYWQKHIPGEPEIIVENLSGGLIAGSNYFGERAPADGLTVGWLAWQALGQALEDPALRIDFRDFEVVGGSTVPVLLYGRTDLDPPVTEPADLVEAQNVRLGGIAPQSSIDLRGRLTLDLLGVEHSYITGYPGGSGVHAATMSGEVHLNLAALNSYRSTYEPALVAPGDGIGYYYIALSGPDGEPRTDPNTPDMPAFHELYEEIHGEPPAGEYWEALKLVNALASDLMWPVFLPEGSPPEALEALRMGFEAARNDPEYQADAERVFGVVPTYRTVEEIEAIRARLDQLDPDIIAFLQGYIDEVQ